MPQTYFISGHLDISNDEFNEHYVPVLDEVLKDKDNCFVTGDAKGTDYLAQKYLSQHTKNITVYHMFEKPLNCVESLKTVGGFKNHEQKDSAMTFASDVDIAWSRSEEEQKKLYGSKYRKRKSGTQKNIERREKMKNKN